MKDKRRIRGGKVYSRENFTRPNHFHKPLRYMRVAFFDHPHLAYTEKGLRLLARRRNK